METTIIALTGSEEKVGKRLQKLAKEKDFDSLGKVLNQIKVPDGFKLSIHSFDFEKVHDIGSESYPMLVTPDGEEIYDNSKEFWKLLHVQDSPEGAWQVYLLHNLWHYLPLFWHANYEKRTYVYSNEHLEIASRYFPDFAEELLKDFDPKKYDICPVIRKVGDIWYVGAHYWSDFGGLIYEELKIKLEGGVHIYSRSASRKTLYHYDCGICF